jgi:hypothetical protein
MRKYLECLGMVELPSNATMMLLEQGLLEEPCEGEYGLIRLFTFYVFLIRYLITKYPKSQNRATKY